MEDKVPKWSREKLCFPITTKPWGKHIPKLAELEAPNKEALDSQLLCFEPDMLNVDTGLPVLKKEQLKEGVYY